VISLRTDRARTATCVIDTLTVGLQASRPVGRDFTHSAAELGGVGASPFDRTSQFK